MKRDGKRGEMRDVGAAGECSGHAFGHELFARFFGLGTCNCTAGPSPKRARASSQGQATMSPAEADLRETRRPRRKRARASPAAPDVHEGRYENTSVGPPAGSQAS